jgi:hypothetical protein
VFALREQKKSDGTTIRSLLTANKVGSMSAAAASLLCHIGVSARTLIERDRLSQGEQHPSLWLDWDEVRQMMLRDLDSKAMTVEIEPEKPKEEEEE